MPPRISKKTSRQQFQQQTGADLGAERRSSKRVAASKAFRTPASYNDEMTEEEAARMFNELPRSELEALFFTVYQKSVDAAQILTVTKATRKRKLEEDFPIYPAAESLGDLAELPNEREFCNASVHVSG